MREKNTDINIQEPAISELRKQRSCLKRSCFSGCGCSVFFLIIILILLNLFTGAGYTDQKSLPDDLPENIEIYEKNRVARITVSDTAIEGKAASYLAFIPKTALAVLYLGLGDSSPGNIQSYYDTITLPENSSTFKKFLTLLQAPIAKQTKKVELYWNHLDAEPRFIQEYYVTELSEAEFNVTIIAENPTRRQIFFEKDDVFGSILIRDAESEDKGTDATMITFSFPI